MYRRSGTLPSSSSSPSIYLSPSLTSVSPSSSLFVCHPNLVNRRWSMHVTVHLETQSCIEICVYCTTLPIIPTPTSTRTIQHTSNYLLTRTHTHTHTNTNRIGPDHCQRENKKRAWVDTSLHTTTDDWRWPRREKDVNTIHAALYPLVSSLTSQSLNSSTLANPVKLVHWYTLLE